MKLDEAKELVTGDVLHDEGHKIWLVCADPQTYEMHPDKIRVVVKRGKKIEYLTEKDLDTFHLPKSCHVTIQSPKLH